MGKVALSPKLWQSLDLISGSRWPKAVAKSCGGHIQSIPHVIQAVANLSSYIYSLDSKRLSILGKDGFRVSSMSVKSGWEVFFLFQPGFGCRRVDMFYVPLPFRASVQAFSKKCGVFRVLRCFFIGLAGLIGWCLRYHAMFIVFDSARRPKTAITQRKH